MKGVETVVLGETEQFRIEHVRFSEPSCNYYRVLLLTDGTIATFWPDEWQAFKELMEQIREGE